MRKAFRLAVFLGCCWAVRLNAQSVLFDFDNAPVHTPLPIDLMVDGITGHFSSSSAIYNYSIQWADVLGFTPAGFAGNCIWPNKIYQSDLLVSFDRALNEASIMYAPEEYATDSSCTMRITAYYGAKFVGTNTYSIDPPGTWPTGVLSLTASEPFTRLVINYDKPPPTGGDYGVIFMADNLVVTPWSAPYARIDSISSTVQNHCLINGVTVPFGTVTILTTNDLAQPFQYPANAVAGGDGVFQFEDIYAPWSTAKFYRVTYP